MYQIIIEHCFFRDGKAYDATIDICSSEEYAKLEIELFKMKNPNYKNHSIIIKKVNLNENS